MDCSFRRKYAFEERIKESTSIMIKYPDRIPIICDKNFNDMSVPQIDRNKYLVPKDLTIGQFIHVIRKRIRLPPERALYLIINNSIPSTSSIIGEIYPNNCNIDRFLYIRYTSENTFGA
jgi:GABA(A) receptor-associated protein